MGDLSRGVAAVVWVANASARADSAGRVRVVVRYIGANSSREGITESKRVKVGEEESGKETIARVRRKGREGGRFPPVKNVRTRP